MARAVLLHQQERFMKTIKMLLASSDRRSANLVQAAVLDACHNKAAVETIRTSRLDELVSLGCYDGIDLVVVIPGALEAAPKSRVIRVTPDLVAQAVQSLKHYSVRPVIAVDVRPQDELLFREAGADAAFCFPFDSGTLKARVRRCLQLSDDVKASDRERHPLAALLLRGLQFLKSA